MNSFFNNLKTAMKVVFLYIPLFFVFLVFGALPALIGLYTTWWVLLAYIVWAPLFFALEFSFLDYLENK